jgi:hypothetical protein
MTVHTHPVPAEADTVVAVEVAVTQAQVIQVVIIVVTVEVEVQAVTQVLQIPLVHPVLPNQVPQQDNLKVQQDLQTLNKTIF